MEIFPFGRTADGRRVNRYRLTGSDGASVDVLNYGGIIQSLVVPDRRGRPADVVLGFETVADYEADADYLGALIGRWAGRISGAGFELGGVRRPLAANDGPNHLHGGLRGFNRQLWAAEDEGGALVLTRLSPDGEEGYPGALSVRVKISFDEHNRLTLEYEAEADADTVVSLTSHPYFNLSGAGSGDVLGQQLFIDAEAVAEIDAALIPTGRLLPVRGTAFDFNALRPIGQEFPAGGFDHYWALARTPEEQREAVARPYLKLPERPAARAVSPATGIELIVFTTEPGLQLYTSGGLHPHKGKGGASYAPCSGFCLEAQFWPNAVNQPAFPPAILKKGDAYRQITRYAFRKT
ncbi:MAG: galactose mutarotase [Candidatus Adiutrix sp.]|jgi:aldose 1-epimerase|nr:galactose mutarotase [Candidatus Adiutrix sp.]